MARPCDAESSGDAKACLGDASATLPKTSHLGKGCKKVMVSEATAISEAIVSAKPLRRAPRSAG